MWSKSGDYKSVGYFMATDKLVAERWVVWFVFIVICQHDVFLVFSNAMLFNDSKTIYYRQVLPLIQSKQGNIFSSFNISLSILRFGSLLLKARAIREVAKKLFAALRTDASNFETEFSLVGQGTDGWSKAEARLINSNSCNHPQNITTGKGRCGISLAIYVKVCVGHISRAFLETMFVKLVTAPFPPNWSYFSLHYLALPTPNSFLWSSFPRGFWLTAHLCCW